MAHWVWTWKAIPARFELFPDEVARLLEEGWRKAYYGRIEIVSGQVFAPYEKYAKRLSLFGMENRRAFWFALRALGEGARVRRLTSRHMLVELDGELLRVGAAITIDARPLRKKAANLLAALSGSGQEEKPGSIPVPMDPVPKLWKGSLSDALWLRISPLLLEGGTPPHRYPLRVRLDVALALHFQALTYKDLPTGLYRSALRLRNRLEEWRLWGVVLKTLEEAGYSP